MIPLRFPESASDFADVHAWLAAVPFTVEAICERRDVASIYELAIGSAPGAEAPRDALDVLLRLFIDTGDVSHALACAQLGDNAVAQLERLGLVRHDHGVLRATVLLYPNEGLWLVSDLPPGDVSNGDVQQDVVYPAVTSSVRTFLSALPAGTGARYLELCAGTGVAALMASARGARTAVAVDITERSTIFARFNAALNELALDARQGDLFAPVKGETFDVIVAHPPYVPALNTQLIFRDGGSDGEQVSRAILMQAAEYLADGGVLCCTCLVTARRNAPVLHRVRDMFGDRADELDLLVLENGVADRYGNFVRELLKAEPAEQGSIVEQLRHFKSLGIERAELVTIVARKHGTARKGTARATGRSRATDWRAVQWALDVQAFLASGATSLDTFMALRPRLSRHARLELSYEAVPDSEEKWQPSSARLHTAYPLVSQMQGNAGDATFVGTLDGSLSFGEVFTRLKADGELPPDVRDVDFAGTMAPLVLHGMVETDRFPFPS